MRTATLILVAYFLCVVLAAIWRLVPLGIARHAIPDIGALTAAYLGLTSRKNLAPAVGGAVVIGYLVDVISGGPVGLSALALGLTGLVARTIQQRILVRGATMTMGFSGFIAIVAAIIGFMIRGLYRMPNASMATELKHVVLCAIATALIGPLVWRAFRRVDAAFARTHRERDAALEGLTP
ncbi:MAG: rod shape-determining protein MreD [Proteobacteria bacterium]|nr:rod shape-determining protein MreD [Pseudomonadota bacterium]